MTRQDCCTGKLPEPRPGSRFSVVEDHKINRYIAHAERGFDVSGRVPARIARFGFAAMPGRVSVGDGKVDSERETWHRRRWPELVSEGVMRMVAMANFKVFIFGLLYFAATGAAAAQTPKITISTDSTPIIRRALKALSTESFRRIGIEVNLVRLPSERSLQAANSGEVDGNGLRTDGLGKTYPDLIQVPESFIDMSLVAFTKDRTIRIDRGWESVKRYRVALITGWKIFEDNVVGAREVTMVDEPEQMFRMLEFGRVDLALYTLPDGIALTKAMALPSIMPVAPSLEEVELYLYLHKKHATLVPKLAQSLRTMKMDGAYDRIVSAQINR